MQKSKKSKKIQIVYSLIFLASIIKAENIFINKTIISPNSINTANAGIIIDGKKISAPSKIKKEDMKIIQKQISCKTKKVSISLPSFSLKLLNEKRCFIKIPKFLAKKGKFGKKEIKIYSQKDFDSKIEISLECNYLELNGDYSFLVKRDFKNLHISSTADGEIKIESKIENLTLNLTGDFKITILKPIKNLFVKYTGDIQIKAFKIKHLQIEGVGDVTIKSKKIESITKDITGDFNWKQ